MGRRVAVCDCRLEEAARLIDSALRARGRQPLSAEEFASLYSRSRYQRLLSSLATVTGIEVAEARDLLAEWHAWNTARSLP